MFKRTAESEIIKYYTRTGNYRIITRKIIADNINNFVRNPRVIIIATRSSSYFVSISCITRSNSSDKSMNSKSRIPFEMSSTRKDRTFYQSNICWCTKDSTYSRQHLGNLLENQTVDVCISQHRYIVCFLDISLISFETKVLCGHFLL